MFLFFWQLFFTARLISSGGRDNNGTSKMTTGYGRLIMMSLSLVKTILEEDPKMNI